jgi:hypothetical protein
MIESGTEHPVSGRDRKLGDEWSDWKADDKSAAPEINEPRFTFSFLAAVVISASLAMIAMGWYLIKPRIDQISPYLSIFAGLFIIFVTVLSLFIVLLESIAIINGRKSLFPYRLIEKSVLSILPKAIWLGGRFGISRDKVGNSFIKVHNSITKSHADTLNPDRLLILLPRCLKKEAKERIIDKTQGNALKVLTVAGGEQARAAITQYRPTLILALACERDLMSGIKDVAEKIPVLAIPNKRPEGPCKNTDFSIDELEETLIFITGMRHKKNY